MRASVMVLERDPLVREGLCALLRGWDFDVVAGSGPDNALRAARNMTQPDFAIVAAPDGDAAVGAAWVAEVHARYRHLPTILVADQPASGVAPICSVQIDWPVQAGRLRDAVAVVIS